MNLPVPTEAEVAEFKRIYDRLYGTDITMEDARDAAMRLLHLYYVAAYGPALSGRQREAPAPEPPAPSRRPSRRRPHRPTARRGPPPPPDPGAAGDGGLGTPGQPGEGQV